jgi:phage terminase large subunit-like protein
MSKTAGPNSNDDGILTEFTPTKYQDAFLRGDKRYLGFVSGVGAGKTYAGIIRTFLNMERWNTGEMGAIVAPTRQMVVNVIIPEMRDLGLLDKWDYNSSYSDEPGLHSPSGSRALILSADNSKTVERLRGLNLAWGWIDERTAVPDRAKEILSQRLRTGNYRNLYETTTPKGKDETYEFYVGGVNATKRSFGEASEYETEDRMAIVGVPTRANPNTPEDYKEDMEANMPDQIAAQEVRGEFVEIGSGILTRDMLTPVSNDVLDSTELTFHVGVDLGIEADAARAEANDTDYFAASIIAHHRRHGEAFVVDVARKRGLSLSQGVEWLREVVSGVPKPRIKVEAVHAQEYFLQAAKDAGLPVHGVDQSLKKEDRLIQLSVPFENDTIRLVNFRRDPGEGLDERWNQLVQEWIAFPDGTHDDMLDAVEIGLRGMSIGQTLGGEGLDLYGRDTEGSSQDELQRGSNWRQR